MTPCLGFRWPFFNFVKGLTKESCAARYLLLKYGWLEWRRDKFSCVAVLVVFFFPSSYTVLVVDLKKK